MKKSLLSITFMVPFFIFGQIELDTAKIKSRYNFKTQPVYFLDSVNIDLTKDYLDLTNVESIKVAKGLFRDANNLKTGKVFITSKNKNHNWMTLADLKTTIPIVDPCRQIMYIIDGNLIEDTSGVRIEVSYINSVDFLNMTGIFWESPPRNFFIITTKQPYKKHRTKNSH